MSEERTDGRTRCGICGRLVYGARAREDGGFICGDCDNLPKRPETVRIDYALYQRLVAKVTELLGCQCRCANCPLRQSCAVGRDIRRAAQQLFRKGKAIERRRAHLQPRAPAAESDREGVAT